MKPISSKGKIWSGQGMSSGMMWRGGRCEVGSREAQGEVNKGGCEVQEQVRTEQGKGEVGGPGRRNKRSLSSDFPWL